MSAATPTSAAEKGEERRMMFVVPREKLLEQHARLLDFPKTEVHCLRIPHRLLALGDAFPEDELHVRFPRTGGVCDLSLAAPWPASLALSRPRHGPQPQYHFYRTVDWERLRQALVPLRPSDGRHSQSCGLPGTSFADEIQLLLATSIHSIRGRAVLYGGEGGLWVPDGTKRVPVWLATNAAQDKTEETTVFLGQRPGSDFVVWLLE